MKLPIPPSSFGAALACLLALGACAESSLGPAEQPAAAPTSSAPATSADLCTAKVAVDATKLDVLDAEDAADEEDDVDAEDTAGTADTDDAEELTPEELAEERADLEEQYGAAFARLERTAGSTQVAGDVATLVRLAKAGIAEGDDEFGLSSEFNAAENKVDAYLSQNCGYAGLTITGVDYRYSGVPSTLAPGITAITLRNDGQELHEVELLRFNDGVTLTPAQLVTLDDEDRILASASMRALVTALPGTSATGFFDLPEGRYAVVCNATKGSTKDADFDGDGPEHATLGMLGEFRVGTANSAPTASPAR